jgi:hypothetical protein
MPQLGLGASLLQQSGASSGPAAPAATHVFLLVGQSNMVGRDTFDGGLGYPAGTLQYGYTEASASPVDTTTTTASPPLDHWDETAGDMGLALQFTIDYVNATGANVVLIPAADGGTGFSSPSEWSKGDTHYEHAVNATNNLMAANTDWIFKGILWHQGEHDYLLSTYADDLHLMIQNMRNDITVATQDTPFILGDLLSATISSQTTALNQGVIDVTPDYVYNTAVASSTGLTDIGDSLHFNAASLRTCISMLLVCAP